MRDLPPKGAIKIAPYRIAGIRNAGYPAGGIFVILLLSREGDARMDARPKTRQVDRERKTPSTQVPRGAKQIVIPMIRQQYDGIWQDAEACGRSSMNGPSWLRSCSRRTSTKAIACTASGVSRASFPA